MRGGHPLDQSRSLTFGFWTCLRFMKVWGLRDPLSWIQHVKVYRMLFLSASANPLKSLYWDLLSPGGSFTRSSLRVSHKRSSLRVLSKELLKRFLLKEACEEGPFKGAVKGPCSMQTFLTRPGCQGEWYERPGLLTSSSPLSSRTTSRTIRTNPKGQDHQNHPSAHQIHPNKEPS